MKSTRSNVFEFFYREGCSILHSKVGLEITVAMRLSKTSQPKWHYSRPCAMLLPSLKCIPERLKSKSRRLAQFTTLRPALNNSIAVPMNSSHNLFGRCAEQLNLFKSELPNPVTVIYCIPNASQSKPRRSCPICDSDIRSGEIHLHAHELELRFKQGMASRIS